MAEPVVFQIPIERSVELRQTCEACPEQYDAYIDGDRVGYLRLRWGYFSVECPWVNGEQVYEADIGGGYTGSFESNEQRAEQLRAACAAISRWYESREDERKS